MSRITRRRSAEVFSLSFLDVICCGFGAIILLLMITKVTAPLVLEQSALNLEATVAMRENAMHEIRGQIDELQRQLDLDQNTLRDKLRMLAALDANLTRFKSKSLATKEEAEETLLAKQKLASIRQSLTDEMERLLGAGFTPQNDLVGGVAVDSEYVIFVIDTSGSMQSMAWPVVIRKVQEALAVYPNLKGIQVMSDEGDYMFPGFAGTWIPTARHDGPASSIRCGAGRRFRTPARWRASRPPSTTFLRATSASAFMSSGTTSPATRSRKSSTTSIR